MADIDYHFLQRVVDMQIVADPTNVTFYTQNNVAWATVGRLEPAGSRTFGRLGQSLQLPGTEVVGSQLHVLVLPFDDTMPRVNDEVRTTRHGVLQRFIVVTVVPSPWKIEVILDESR